MVSVFWCLLQAIAFVGAIERSSFLQPLSREEERMWLDRLLAGDEQARETLILHNMRLCAGMRGAL